MPAEVKQALADGTIREGHARALLTLATREAQVAALKTLVSRALSVRQTEELVRRLTQPQSPKPPPTVSPDVQALEDRFRQVLGTKVSLLRNRQGRGRLVIHFYSEEELQAICDLLYQRFQIAHATVQVESTQFQEPGWVCLFEDPGPSKALAEDGS